MFPVERKHQTEAVSRERSPLSLSVTWWQCITQVLIGPWIKLKRSRVSLQVEEIRVIRHPVDITTEYFALEDTLQEVQEFLTAFEIDGQF